MVLSIVFGSNSAAPEAKQFNNKIDLTLDTYGFTEVIYSSISTMNDFEKVVKDSGSSVRRVSNVTKGNAVSKR